MTTLVLISGPSARAAQRRRVAWAHPAFVLALRAGHAQHRSGATAAHLPAVGMQQPAIETLSSQASRDAHLAALLQAAAGGDSHAFESFYDATVRYTLAVVRRVAGDMHAEDIVADSYFQAWRHAARFDCSRGSALAWLVTIARTRALDRLRQETHRHGGMAGAPDYDPDSGGPGNDPGPEALLESVQASTRLHAALARLSANERWVLGLAYFRDHTHSEIAAVTGLPLGTVKSLITRAQHKLRESLQDGAGAPVAAAPKARVS